MLIEQHPSASITMHINTFAFILLVIGEICVASNDCHSNNSSLCTVIDNACANDPSTCDEVEIESCECINGTCDSMGHCICDDGFQANDLNNYCEPHCTKYCLNGDCIDPNTCLCHDGYHLSYNATEWNICHAICDPDSDKINSCINGTCTSPNNCTCYDGFELSAESRFICVPIAAASSYYYVVWFSIILFSVFLLMAGCYVAVDAIKHREHVFEPAMAVNCVENC